MDFGVGDSRQAVELPHVVIGEAIPLCRNML
jgi:hypothetical protein